MEYGSLTYWKPAQFCLAGKIESCLQVYINDKKLANQSINQNFYYGQLSDGDTIQQQYYRRGQRKGWDNDIGEQFTNKKGEKVRKEQDTGFHSKNVGSRITNN